MSLESDVVRLAESQHSVLALRQLLALGHSVKAVRHIARDRLAPTSYEGVYRLAGSQATWEQALAALVRAAGPEAVASHRSAAALLGMPGFGRGPLEVLTARPWRQRVPGAVVHSSRRLPEPHVTVASGIPTTVAARTLVDLAAAIHPSWLERAVDSALASGLVSVADLSTVTLELAQKGRAGIAAMRTLLEQRSDGYVPPESELEARFLRLLRSAGLPEPVRQYATGDDSRFVGRVDFAYPDHRLLVELDGRRYHSAKLHLESDRRRDNQLVAAGWRVIRITWEQLTQRPEEVVALLRTLLNRSGHGFGPYRGVIGDQKGVPTSHPPAA